MSQKITADSPAGLDRKQLAALESLVSGATITAAGKAAGVSRRTVWRWMRSDPNFQAALNRARQEMRTSAEIRMERLAELAVDVVEQAVSDGDVRTALAVLRGLGFLGGQPISIGADDAGTLAAQARVQEKQRAKDAWMAELVL
jgi:hypothetical protein